MYADDAAGMQDIIGDYGAFFSDVAGRLRKRGIDIAGYPLSHLAWRTATFPEYEETRDRIRRFCIGEVENHWNGRLINKLLLREPLQVAAGTEVSLIELIPPPHQRDYPMGLEHLGVVIGDRHEEFIEQHASLLTGRQDQGPFCQPAYITFGNNRSVKFYRWSLETVVEKEGRVFTSHDKAQD